MWLFFSIVSKIWGSFRLKKLFSTLLSQLNTMKEKLDWSEFKPSSYSEWEQAAEKMLKGKDPKEWLIWKTISGASTPSYADSFSQKLQTIEIEGVESKLNYEASDWIVAEEFSGESKVMNQEILKALEEGVNGIRINSNN